MASMPALTGDVRAWRDRVRHIEDLGFSTVAISDHMTGGWMMDPLVAMTVAAESTTKLRVLSLVLCNDFRHPALVHRAMANLDVFSSGRVEIGLGAGWQRADYDATGLPFQPAMARLDRLAESIRVIKTLFAERSATFTGEHYQISDLPGLPHPVQVPHPPLLVGGGGRRILELAGAEADIVSLNPRLADSLGPGDAVTNQAGDQLRNKVDWVRAAASRAGRRPDEVELQMSMLDLQVRHRGVEHRWSSSIARAATPEQLHDSPAVLHGEVEACVDQLTATRERLGITYVHLGGNLEAAAPIVARLAET